MITVSKRDHKLRSLKEKLKQTDRNIKGGLMLRLPFFVLCFSFLVWTYKNAYQDIHIKRSVSNYIEADSKYHYHFTYKF